MVEIRQSKVVLNYYIFTIIISLIYQIATCILLIFLQVHISFIANDKQFKPVTIP